MQLLGPDEKGMNAKGSLTSAFSSHLSGLN